MNLPTGLTITAEEKLTLANEVESTIRQALAPIITREQGKDTCPCCVGRAVTCGMAKMFGYQAAAAIFDDAGVQEFIELVTAAILMGIQMRGGNGGGRAH